MCLFLQVLALRVGGRLHNLQNGRLSLCLHLELVCGAVCLGQILQEAKLCNLDAVGGRLGCVAQNPVPFRMCDLVSDHSTNTHTHTAYIPKHLVQLQFGWKVLVHQLQRLPDFVVHRRQQIGAQLVEESRQQYKQPVVQVVGVRQNQLVDRVQEQRVDLGVRVNEHLAEQLEDVLQLVLGQFVALAEVVRQAGQALFALRPVRGRAVQNDGRDVFDWCTKAVQLVA